MIIPRPGHMPDEDSIIMIVKENLVLQREGANPLPVLSKPVRAQLWQSAQYLASIGSYQGREVFLVVPGQDVTFDGFEFLPLRRLLSHFDSALFAIAGRACQVAYFIRTHNFCSHCGDPLQEVEDELAVYCASCDYRTYPRISPCIIVAVFRQDRGKNEILLARGIRHPEGLYSVLAGFVESGETLEQTVQREVYEETRILVDNVEYVTSQPWPFPHSLMAGFVAQYAGGELQVDDVEIIEGDWFELDQLPQTPPAGTIAAQLIEEVRSRLQGLVESR
ncbi:NAD(+) diphosphatase [Aliidiomarina soli]|uniref:NAD(+) diphosphatase n=1 Tax=Aliidiomarina soli TaxID=1928574 RepID=A0A432WFW0_9GAMM|nr:NAD(+) diphosphatase [Aliidiomarina soli]RUO32597.1 NAD(+) diphosphatase [Aliidiomarina soli]